MREKILSEAFITDPYPVLERLRNEAPVKRVTTPDGTTVWLVTRYADVRVALTDPRLSLDRSNATSEGDQGSSLPDELSEHLLNRDGTQHMRLRRLVAKAFTARRVDELTPRIEATVDQMMDTLAPAGRSDLIADLATPLSMTVICDLLGVPADNRADFRQWTNTLLDPAPEAPRRSRVAMGAMHDFLVRLLARRQATPADDILSALLRARDHDGQLTDRELVALAFLILFGGYDTTANLIGNAVYLLVTNERLLSSVRARHVTLADVVEHALGSLTPFQFAVRRFPVEPVTIGGVTIPAGERVWLCLASANRDTSRFNDSGFLNQRDVKGHLSFGHGTHYCLGASLARLQTRIVLGRLLDRFSTVALDCPTTALRWRDSYRSRGLQSLPIHFA